MIIANVANNGTKCKRPDLYVRMRSHVIEMIFYIDFTKSAINIKSYNIWEWNNVSKIRYIDTHTHNTMKVRNEEIPIYSNSGTYQMFVAPHIYKFSAFGWYFRETFFRFLLPPLGRYEALICFDDMLLLYMVSLLLLLFSV